MKRMKFLSLLMSAVMLTACSTASEGGEGTREQSGSGSTEAADNTDTAQTGANEEKTEVYEVKPIEYEIDPTKPVIALTFDDGPNTTTTNQVLDLLAKYNVRASFFLIGDNINDESAESVKRAYDMGCEINNHSKTHSYMDKMSAEDIKAEVEFVSGKVEEITGKPTVFFRPPYIAVNDTMYANIDMPFISGFGCSDWDAKVDVERRLKVLRRQIKDGAIILLHDAQGNDLTVEMLDILIPELIEQGYQFATVSELFEAKGVEISGEDTNLYSEVGTAAQ